MNIGRHDIAEIVLMDYLHGALPLEEQREVESRLKRDLSLRQTLNMLRAQEQALYELGRGLREITPEIHLADSVMRAIQDIDGATDPIEDELIQIGECLKAELPPVDLKTAVLSLLPPAENPGTSGVLAHELVGVGNDLRDRSPRVNIVRPVMKVVEKESEDKTVPFPEYACRKAVQRRDNVLSWRLMAAVAAGIVLVAGFLLVQVMQPEQIGRMDIAKRELPKPAATASPVARNETKNTPPSLREGEPLAFTRVPAENLALMSTFTRPAKSEDANSNEAGGDVSKAGFTMEDILRARQKSLEGQADAAAMLARWGALDPDEVRRLLAEGLLTPSQLAGLSRFLPDEESIDLLKQAIKDNPEDPALRFALAKQLMNSPNGYEEAFTQLAELRNLAPNNALVDYMDAQIRFSMGDYSGGLSMLEYASTLNSASTFSLANAQNHSTALQAAGMTPDLANTLAAFYAGTDEFASVTDLRNNLLQYGSYLESVGDYDTAMAVYKGVGSLGSQISRGASYYNDYLAGLESQQAAIDAMNALADLMDIPGGLEALQDTYGSFVEGLNVFLEYTDLLDDVAHIEDLNVLLTSINGILQTGDIRYLQGLIGQ